jgi:hypothetical protein
MTSKAPKVIIKKTSGRTREGLSDFKFEKHQMPQVKDANLRDYRENAWGNF